MAQFCTKCGNSLAEGMKFCTSCGATIEGPPAPAAQSPPAPLVEAPPPMAPVAQVPPPAPPRPVPVAPALAAPKASSGSPVLKIVLIVLAVLILLGLLSAGACVYMVYRAKQKVAQFEKQVRVTFPTTTAMQPAAPPQAPGQPAGPVIDLGVPVYPGATPTEAGSSMSIGGGAVKVQQYTTSDSPDKVIAFYKDKLGPNAMVTQRGDQALVQLAGSNGYVNISIAPDSSTGKTKFTISSIGK